MAIRGAQLPCATEEQECIAFIDWTMRVFYRREALFERVVHIPNERDKHVSLRPGAARTALIRIGKLKAQGVKDGFPDYMVLAHFPTCAGLYIEAKRRRGGRTPPDQIEWRERLIGWGYHAVICNGADQMIAATQAYFEQHAPAGDWINRVRLR